MYHGLTVQLYKNTHQQARMGGVEQDPSQGPVTDSGGEIRGFLHINISEIEMHFAIQVKADLSAAKLLLN